MKNSFLNTILFLLISLTTHAGDYGIVPNIRETDPGRFYRSAQLKANTLEKLIKKKNIKTVINLRGENKGGEWYQNEIRVTQELGATHYDIGMGASRLPHKDDLKKLLAIYETAERPILIHCLAGADRTGEATAIYEMLYMRKSKAEALKQLSLKYFHLAASKPAKRYFIKDLWLGADWAKNAYDPCAADYKYYDKEKFCNSGNTSLVEEVEAEE